MQSLFGKKSTHGSHGTHDPTSKGAQETHDPTADTHEPTVHGTKGTHGKYGAHVPGTHGTKTTFSPELNDSYTSLNSLYSDIKNYSGDLDGLNALQRKLNAIENRRTHGAFGWKGEAQSLPEGQSELHRMLHLCYQEIRHKLEALGHREELEIHPKLMYIKNDLDSCLNCLNSCRSVTGDDQANFSKLRDVYRCQGILYHIESKRMNGMFVPPECLAYTPVKDVSEGEIKGTFDPTRSRPTDEPAALRQKETLTLPVDVIRGQAVLHDELFECWELSYLMANDLENRFGFGYRYGGPSAVSTAAPSTTTQYAEKGYERERYAPSGTVTELPSLLGETKVPSGVNIRELIVGNVSVCDLGLLANQLRDAIAALRDVRPQVIERPVVVPSEPKVIEKAVPVPSEPKIIEKAVPVPSEPQIIEKPVVVPSEPQVIEKTVPVPSEPRVIEKPVVIEKEVGPKEVTIPQPEVRTKLVTVPADEAERIMRDTAGMTQQAVAAAAEGQPMPTGMTSATTKTAPGEITTSEWAKMQQGTPGAA